MLSQRFGQRSGVKLRMQQRIERLRIDYLQSRNLSLKLGNSSFDMALLLAGGIIFGILRKVALFASFGNGGDNIWAINGF